MRERDGEVRMRVKEYERYRVIQEVLGGQRTQVSGATLVGVSGRWMKVLVKRVREKGKAGLVHGNCGRASNRRLKEAMRQEIARLYGQEYEDFNLNHFRQMLREREGWVQVPSRETLRRVLREAGLWKRQRAAPKHRQRRPRRECEGELLQVDASIHEWLGEGRGYVALVGAIDDATGEVVELEFFEQETTEAYMKVLKGVLRRKGVPGAIYSDRDSVFRVNDRRERERSWERGERPQTQFGRILKELGIEWIEARSPQAKGRIERLWKTLQDRLLKELWLERILSLKAANEYVRKVFLPRFNREFRKVAARPEVVYRECPLARDLDRVLCWKVERTVAGDHTVRHEGQVWQILPHPQIRALRGKRVEVRKTLNQRLEVWYGGWKLAIRPARPEPAGAVGGRRGNPVRGRVRVGR